eukprot:Gregarina_sp_Poly_1__279@NODE_1069_length_5189_cov_13_860016_g742_i0_p2_GENE_NODE_1069_length_5189_cov_13_860016_g742_i0NODE_1069_length_5189_cov_13_860016_g742_i0_p2_ORF_typecomplete_len606_score98_81_NODE_1069_length_5189_cov_13_860016_g742_i02072024
MDTPILTASPAIRSKLPLERRSYVLLEGLPSPAVDRWLLAGGTASYSPRFMAAYRPRWPRECAVSDLGAGRFLPQSHIGELSSEKQRRCPPADSWWLWLLRFLFPRLTRAVVKMRRSLLHGVSPRGASHRSRSRPSESEQQQARRLLARATQSAEIYGVKSLQVRSAQGVNSSVHGCTLVGPGFITVPEYGEIVIFAPDRILRSLKLDVDPAENQVLIAVPEGAKPHFFIVDAPGYIAHAKDVITGIDKEAAQVYSSLVFFRREGGLEVASRGLRRSPLEEYGDRIRHAEADEEGTRRLRGLQAKTARAEQEIRDIIQSELQRSMELAERIKRIDLTLTDLNREAARLSRLPFASRLHPKIPPPAPGVASSTDDDVPLEPPPIAEDGFAPPRESPPANRTEEIALASPETPPKLKRLITEKIESLEERLRSRPSTSPTDAVPPASPPTPTPPMPETEDGDGDGNRTPNTPDVTATETKRRSPAINRDLKLGSREKEGRDWLRRTKSMEGEAAADIPESTAVKTADGDETRANGAKSRSLSPFPFSQLLTASSPDISGWFRGRFNHIAKTQEDLRGRLLEQQARLIHHQRSLSNWYKILRQEQTNK